MPIEELIGEVRRHVVALEAEALMSESWDRISDIVDEIRWDAWVIRQSP